MAECPGLAASEAGGPMLCVILSLEDFLEHFLGGII
jgi:hypothetical protein